jgi:hypothetical protein
VVARTLLAAAWGLRWAALAVLLFSAGQAETWPWTIAQIAADLLFVALLRWAVAYVAGGLAARRAARPPREVPGYLPGTLADLAVNGQHRWSPR